MLFVTSSTIITGLRVPNQRFIKRERPWLASRATVNDRDLTIEAIIRKDELCLRGPGLRISGGKCQRGHWD